MAKKLFRISLIIAIISLLFLKPEFKSVIDPSLLYLYSAIFLFFFIFHLWIEKDEYRGNWFRVDVIFLIGFLIVHFQWPVMYSFSDIVPDEIHRVWVDERYVNYGIWLSLLGGLSWFLGYYSLRKRIKPITLSKISFDYQRLLNFTTILFIIFLLSAGRNFLTGGIYKGHGGSSAGEGVSAYVQLLYSICILILTTFVVLKSKSAYRGNVVSWFLKLDKQYLLLIGTYIILFFSIGDRGGPTSLLIAIMILIGFFVRSIKLKELIALVTVGGIFLTIIGIGRSIDSDKHTLARGYQEFELESPYETTLVLANSIRTLFYSLEEVPEKSDFFYGKLWLGGIMSPIPFLQSTYLHLTGEEGKDISSTNFITYIVYGDNPTSGEGATLIADIYLNFGPPGVLIVMFIVGLLIKKVNSELLLQSHYKWIVISILIGAGALSWSRGTFLQFLRSIIWGLIIIKIFVRKRKIQ